MNPRTWLLAPVLALALLPSGLVPGAVPVLRTEWSASASAMGWAIAAYQAGYVIGVLVLLPLTDRFGSGRVVALAVAATATASLLFPLLAQDIASASALRLFAGFGLAGVYMPGIRMVASAAGVRRGLAVGAYVSAFYVGEAGSFWATGTMLPEIGWRGAAAVLGALAVVAVPLAVLATRGTPRPEGFASWRALKVIRDPRISRTVAGYTGHAWELYASRAWLAAFLASVVAGAGAVSVRSAAQGGQWAALIVGIGAIGVWLGGWVSDHFGRMRTAFAIAVLSGCLSLVFGQLGGAGWTVLAGAGCLYGVLMAADSGVYSTAVTELAPAGTVGTAQALQASIGFLATIAAPVAAGAVIDLGGGFQAAFIVAGLGSLAGAAALLPMLSRQPPTARPVSS